MLSVHSSVKMNLAKIDALDQNAVKALEQTADAFKSELKNAQVMPFDTGNLQNESTFVDYSQSQRGVVTLSSSTPYARRLYYHPEYNFQHTHNRAAGGEWLRFWLPGGKRQNFCRETFKENYRRLCRL